MGANASRGRDNESLMDKLVESGYTLPPDLERAMRLVDRGNYFGERSSRAYMDLAWRAGTLHLSAPSIYISVLKNLDLAPGQRFLNIGSGSGYLSTIVGLILGYDGLSHGIELIESNVQFSRNQLETFLAESDAPLERNFCRPYFMHGNIFDLVSPPELNLPQQLNEYEELTERPTPSGPVDVEASNGELDSLPQPHVEPEDDEEEEEDREMREGSPSPQPRPNAVDNIEEEHPEEHENDHEERHPISWNGTFPIEPPPFVDAHERNGTESPSDSDLAEWLTYDRIYVGAAVQNRAQLWSILRLLRVGGILVAPVQDELVKITRLSADRISGVNLLSVSFAPLLSARPENKVRFHLPPRPEIPRLVQLCARMLRDRLRELIEQRHKGRPTLGRLEEIKDDDKNKTHRSRPQTADDEGAVQVENGNDTATPNGACPSDSYQASDMEDESDDAEEEDDHPPKPDRDASTASEGSENSLSSADSTSENRGMARLLNTLRRFVSPTNSAENRPIPRPVFVPFTSVASLRHHLLLRSRNAPTEQQQQSTTTSNTGASPANLVVPERDRGQASEESGSSGSHGHPSRIFMFSLLRGLNESSHPEQARGSDQESRIQFQFHVSDDLTSGSHGDSQGRSETAQPASTEGDSVATNETEPLRTDQPNETRERRRVEVDNSGRTPVVTETISAQSTERPKKRAKKTKRRPNLKYHPPSYRYRDEMRKILLEELHVSEFFVRAVLTL
ncbi:unnamed protein product [Calicophoron daubneyi]|uniref:Uncharacterized protein n=1 Tax=Calicophoron daubneyi TaxID=300641 RepID=A0AAV2SZD6_CALDB